MKILTSFAFALLFAFGAAIVAAPLVASHAAAQSDRAMGQVIDDAAITARVKTALAKEIGVSEAMNVNVTTYRGTVQLSGFLGTRELADRAARVARSLAGIESVQNDIQVASEANGPGASTGGSQRQ